MDEEQNNEQNLVKKTSQDVQDTANAVKDGANLAKNASTGNVLGAVKSGIKLLKNKKTLKIIIISLLIPIIITIALAGSLFAIFDVIGNTIQDIVKSIANLLTIDDKWDGSIEISNDDVDKVIEAVENMGFDMNDIWLLGDVEYKDSDSEETLKEKQREASRKYIKKFLEAQLVTETPHYEPTLSSGNAYGQKTYGKVYLYRTSDAEVVDENTRLYEMSWMPYTKMKEEAAKNNKDGLNAVRMHYSIDENGQLVIAQWTIIETEIDGKSEPDKIIINLRHIDYKSAISQYTTPVNFLIYLTMVSQNPEFVSAVTELIKNNTKIDITLLDTVTKIEEVETYTCTNNSKGVSESGPDENGNIERTPWRSSSNAKTVTKTTTTSTIPVPKVTYAKTWFSEQRVTYNLETTKENFSENITLPDDPEPAGDTGSWTTNKNITIDTEKTTTEYKEGTRGNVIDKTGEKGDQGVTPNSYKDKEKREVKDRFNIDSKSTFLGLLDDFFRIPNTKKYEASGKNNMVSGAEWLFYLLQKDGNLQNLEQVMRYVMYKYTGKDYGVKELDLSIFDIRDFVTILTNSDSLEEILKSYENEQLRRYMNGETSLYSSVEKYVTQDRKSYKMFYTSFDGCLNFSYGIMVRNSNGTINNKEYFAAEGIDLEQLLRDYDNGKEVLVDVDKLDRIFTAIIQDKKNLIKDMFEAKGVTLKENQLDALVCVAYQYGNCGQYINGSDNIIELYKNYYERGDTDTFKARAKAQTGSGGTDYIFSDSTERKKRNWELFNEGRYILSNGSEIKKDNDVGSFALQFVGERHKRFTDWYGFADEWCAMFVSYCYNECGLIPNVLKEKFAACSPEVRTLQARGEFISRDSGYIPSSGDIIFIRWEGHTELASHVGIVTGCDGYNVTTVEGNRGSKPYYETTVITDSYNINSTLIVRIFPSTIINKGDLYEK